MSCSWIRTMLCSCAMTVSAAAHGQGAGTIVMRLGLEAVETFYPQYLLDVTEPEGDPCVTTRGVSNKEVENKAAVGAGVVTAVMSPTIRGSVKSVVTDVATVSTVAKFAARAKLKTLEDASTQRDRDVCHLFWASQAMLGPIATEMEDAFGKQCGVTAAQIRDDRATMNTLGRCVDGKTQMAAELGDFKVRIFSTNHLVCLAIRNRLLKYDRLRSRVRSDPDYAGPPAEESARPGPSIPTCAS